VTGNSGPGRWKRSRWRMRSLPFAPGSGGSPTPPGGGG
jgi:hypothetical protein